MKVRRVGGIVAFCILIVAFGLLAWPETTFAQGVPQYNIAETLNLVDEEALDGDIVRIDEEGNLTRTEIDYDQRMFGVVVENPVVVYRTNETLPITRAGTAFVNVTTIGGDISIGDFITSSKITGKGRKATELTGYVLGVALGSFNQSSGTQTQFEGETITEGKVKVAVGIGPASPVVIQSAGGPLGTLTQLISTFFLNITRSPRLERLIRFILAAIIILLTIYMSYRTFGKNVTKGIEAIGRNPLAKVSIQSMIILNVVLIVVVVFGGIVLALLIISL